MKFRPFYSKEARPRDDHYGRSLAMRSSVEFVYAGFLVSVKWFTEVLITFRGIWGNL